MIRHEQHDDGIFASVNRFPQVSAGAELSIVIPTYNRSHFLVLLLGALHRAAEQDPELTSRIDFYVIDNASPDQTRDVVNRSPLPILYRRHKRNIGGDANILWSYCEPQTPYVWVIGDDDVPTEGALTRTLALLNEHHPGLMVMTHNRNAWRRRGGCNAGRRFEDFREFIRQGLMVDFPLMEHSLVSSNVVRTGTFDRGIGAAMQPYSFHAHLYAICGGMLRSGESVLVSPDAVVGGAFSAHDDAPVDKVGCERGQTPAKLRVMRSLFDAYAWILSQAGHSPAQAVLIPALWMAHSATAFYNPDATLAGVRPYLELACRAAGASLSRVAGH